MTPPSPTEQKAMTMSRDEMLKQFLSPDGTYIQGPTEQVIAALRSQAGSKPLRQDGGCSCARAGFPESCDNCDGAHARRIRRLALRGVSDKLDEIAPAVEALARHQEQCDEDGVMVQVSRQAVDEVVNTINQIAIDLAAHPANSGQQPPARSVSMDDLVKTISDEWGSHLCFRDSFGQRSCGQDHKGVGCRCFDIANAIAANFNVTSPPREVHDPVRDACCETGIVPNNVQRQERAP